jgi:hypothetical protein
VTCGAALFLRGAWIVALNASCLTGYLRLSACQIMQLMLRNVELQNKWSYTEAFSKTNEQRNKIKNSQQLQLKQH